MLTACLENVCMCLCRYNVYSGASFSVLVHACIFLSVCVCVCVCVCESSASL